MTYLHWQQRYYAAASHLQLYQYTEFMCAAESPNEHRARFIVSTTLKVPVRRYDDGSHDRMVDAVIEYPDRNAALEVIADHDADFNSLDNELRKVNYRLKQGAETENGWTIRLEHRTRLKRLTEELPALLMKAESLDLDDIATPGSEDEWRLCEAIRRLGVVTANTGARVPRGEIRAHPTGWSGIAHSCDLGHWVGDILSHHRDVPLKLGQHIDAAERHAFIWTTIGSNYAIQHELENADRGAPQHGGPPLPEGVSHVWVAGSFMTQGVIAWFPGRGWWRTGWVWPDVLTIPPEPWTY